MEVQNLETDPLTLGVRAFKVGSRPVCVCICIYAYTQGMCICGFVRKKCVYAVMCICGLERFLGCVYAVFQENNISLLDYIMPGSIRNERKLD